jgi:hypothetical protein
VVLAVVTGGFAMVTGSFAVVTGSQATTVAAHVKPLKNGPGSRATSSRA